MARQRKHWDRLMFTQSSIRQMYWVTPSQPVSNYNIPGVGRLLLKWILMTFLQNYSQWRIQGDAAASPSARIKIYLNDYILGMYDCKCLTTPGCRQCTPVDVTNKSIFFINNNDMIYMYNVSEQTELWPTDISLRHSHNRVKCITYCVCFSLSVRPNACPCLSAAEHFLQWKLC